MRNDNILGLVKVFMTPTVLAAHLWSLLLFSFCFDDAFERLGSFKAFLSLFGKLTTPKSPTKGTQKTRRKTLIATACWCKNVFFFLRWF
jgi:hypothetical protein